MPTLFKVKLARLRRRTGQETFFYMETDDGGLNPDGFIDILSLQKTAWAGKMRVPPKYINVTIDYDSEDSTSD